MFLLCYWGELENLLWIIKSIKYKLWISNNIPALSSRHWEPDNITCTHKHMITYVVGEGTDPSPTSETPQLYSPPVLRKGSRHWLSNPRMIYIVPSLSEFRASLQEPWKDTETNKPHIWLFGTFIHSEGWPRNIKPRIYCNKCCI